jgi:C_GCAxxG_C_C family probable redox protein
MIIFRKRDGKMDLIQEVNRYHDSGCNCSQSVFNTFAGQFGIAPEKSNQVAAAFGGGMGRSGLTCGAVTGALMVLGMRFGPKVPSDQAAKELTYQKAREFMIRFKEENGDLDCLKLVGMDISTPEGWQKARELKVFSTTCPKYLESAVSILDEMLKGE